MIKKNNKPTTHDGDRLGAIPLDQRPDGRMIAEAAANAEINDIIYQEARKKIRARGGLMTTDEAVEAVLKEDFDIIKEKVFASMEKDDPLFARHFKIDPKAALALLESEIREAESQY